MFLGALAQLEFLDLARRGLRQRAKDNRSRHLVMREVGAAPRDYIRGRDRTGILLERHESARGLAPVRVGFGDHRRLDDLRVAVEHFLDLERRDVFATRDDDVLGPVLDLDVTVGMTNTEVAGMEPALCEGRL